MNTLYLSIIFCTYIVVCLSNHPMINVSLYLHMFLSNKLALGNLAPTQWNLFVYISIFQFLYLCIFLSISSIYLSTPRRHVPGYNGSYASTYLSIYLYFFIYSSIFMLYLSIFLHLSIYIFAFIHLYFCIYLSIFLHLSIYLSIYLSI